MPQLSIETRTRVVQLHKSGYSVAAIVRRLEEELISVSRVAVYKLLKKHKQEGNVGDRVRRPRSAKNSLYLSMKRWWRTTSYL